MSDQTNGHHGSSGPSAPRPAPAESTRPARVEITQSEAEAVSGGVVRMEQSGAGQVKAQSVQMVNSGAQSVETLKADISASGMVVLKAREVIMDQCGIGVLQGETINAHRVNAVLVAGPVHGNLRALLTPAAAFALGLGAASGLALAGLLGRSLLGRRRLPS